MKIVTLFRATSAKDADRIFKIPADTRVIVGVNENTWSLNIIHDDCSEPEAPEELDPSEFIAVQVYDEDEQLIELFQRIVPLDDDIS